jgi:hypothetical protein
LTTGGTTPYAKTLVAILGNRNALRYNFMTFKILKKRHIFFLNRINAGFILFIFLLFSSCSTLKSITESNDCEKLDKSTLSLINGAYNRFSMDSIFSNANDLFWLFSMKGHNIDRNEDFVKLSVIDERHIEITLIKKDSIIYIRTLKGKLKDNAFEFNRRIKFYPVIVATIYMDSKTRIRLLKNGNLIIDAKSMQYGLTFFVLPLGGSEKEYNSIFERQIKNSN